MKRIIIVILAFIVFTICVPTVAFAAEDEYSKEISQYDLSAFDDLPDDTKKVLENLGIDDFDYESITSLRFEDFINIILDVVKNNIKSPLKSASIVLVFCIFSAFLTSFNNGRLLSENASVYSTATSLVLSIVIAAECASTISLCCSTIEMCADFIYAFIPTFFVIIAVSGGTITSLSTNSLLLVLSQGLNMLSKSIFIPIVNCFLALSICSGLRSELNVSGLISGIRRIIITSISVVSGAFVAVLSIKTAVASRADALGLRSLRFAINSVVPVIGSAISEGLLSIQSYSSLIKSGVGIVGIIAVASFFLPALVSTVVWRVSLYIGRIISDVFEDTSVSRIIDSFSGAFLLMNVILILSMVTTIISIGILVATKTAG